MVKVLAMNVEALDQAEEAVLGMTDRRLSHSGYLSSSPGNFSEHGLENSLLKSSRGTWINSCLWKQRFTINTQVNKHRLLQSINKKNYNRLQKIRKLHLKKGKATPFIYRRKTANDSHS